MEKTSDSSFKELMNAIQYCLESKKGKYTLETYLKIIGEYTDRLILESENNGLIYISGQCQVEKKIASEEILEFQIEMYFHNRESEVVKKEARRTLPAKKFTRETMKVLGNKTLRFKIDKLEGDMK